MAVDFTKIDAIELNVLRRLFWGTRPLRIYGRPDPSRGYLLLEILRQDWYLELSPGKPRLPSQGTRLYPLGIADTTGRLAAKLEQAVAFEVNRVRYTRESAEEPLGVERIWQFAVKANREDRMEVYS